MSLLISLNINKLPAVNLAVRYLIFRNVFVEDIVIVYFGFQNVLFSYEAVLPPSEAPVIVRRMRCEGLRRCGSTGDSPSWSRVQTTVARRERRNTGCGSREHLCAQHEFQG